MASAGYSKRSANSSSHCPRLVPNAVAICKFNYISSVEKPPPKRPREFCRTFDEEFARRSAKDDDKCEKIAKGTQAIEFTCSTRLDVIFIPKSFTQRGHDYDNPNEVGARGNQR